MIAAKNHGNGMAKSLCPYAQGFRLRVLQHRFRQKTPMSQRAAAAAPTAR